MADDGLALPPGARLLHIGPHKTGTTALQRALQDGRERLLEHGVVYPGNGPSHIRGAVAVTGARGLVGAPKTSMREWRRLVKRVEAAGDRRVVISSEFFDMADDATARSIVEELGGPQVHVVVTLRPLAKILPSAWQQAVRSRLRLSYEAWLERLFAETPKIQTAKTFWKRHHHDVLIARWAQAVGTDNLTVVVLDESDRMMLLHTFEQLLAVPADTLRFTTGRTNRSLTLPEIELIRRLNQEFRRREWSEQAYARYIRLGVVEHLQLTRQPPADEPGITTPRWALERAAEIGARAATAIASSGVRVVGDLSTLGAGPGPGAPDDGAKRAAAVAQLPTDAAMTAVVGAILAASPGDAATGKEAPAAAPRKIEDRAVREVGARTLLGVVARRARKRLRR